MKKLLYTAIFFIITVLSYAQTASWTAYKPALFPTNASGQIHGISRVSQMKFHPSNSLKMYAVSARGGLFISNDGGNNWVVAPGCDNLTLNTRFASVCIDHVNDQVIYLGGGDHNYYSSGSGVWKSTNGGSSFSQTTLTGKIVVDMIMDPSNNNIIVAATNTGVYKTTDAGATWTLKSASLALDDLKQKASNGSRTLFVSTRNAELYRSDDFGDTWIQVTSGIFIPTGYTTGGGTRIAVTPADTNVVYFYMNAQGGTLFKSTDGGNNFTAVKNNISPFLTGYTNSSADPGQGDYNTGLGVDRANANIVYFVAHNVWKSTDGGVTWTQLTVWYQKVHTDMHQIVTSPYNNSQLWNMNDGGVWLSTDGGNNWTPKSDGIYGYEIYHGSCSPTRRDMMSIGTQDNGELYANSTTWYTNRGGDWQSHCVFDYRANSSMVYYFLPDWGTVQLPRRRLVTGSTASYGLPASVTDFSDIAFFRGNPDLAFVGDTVVLRTTNLTLTTPSWTSIYNTGVKIMAMHVNFADSNKLYVITSDQKIHISTNALSATPTFTVVSLPNATSTSASITSVKSSPNTIYISTNTRVYRSADNGLTWTAVTYNLPSYNHAAIIADEYFSSNELVFVASGGSVYYKTASATSWSIYSSSLPSRTTIVDMSIFNDGTSNTLLRVFTYGRGVWETPINNLRTTTANFVADNTSPCIGQPVNFSDLSTGTVVSRSWSFPGGTPSTSASTNPVVTYASPGRYDVTLTVSNGTTSSTKTVTSYISTLGVQLPVSEGFESGAFPPAGWINVDAGNNGSTWQLKSGAGGFGTSASCMFFDNYGINTAGAFDEFRSSTLDLTPYASANLKFDLAYQQYSTSTYIDSLQILVSTDCGTTFSSVYLKFGAALATVTGTNTAAFTPTSAQWRTESINMNAFLGQNVIIAFRNIGRYGNNIHIDNIQLSAVLATNAGPDKVVCLGTGATIGSAPVSGFNYSWSPATGLNSASVSNPIASPASTTTYVLTATYSPSGVSQKDTVIVTVTASPAITTSTTSTSAPTAADGTATATVNGGTAPYFFSWNTSPVQTTSTALNLPTGNYFVTVTDATGCSNTGSASLSAPSCSLNLSVVHTTDNSCNGFSDGAVTLEATGGDGFYTYSIVPGGSSNSTGIFSGLSSGNYTASVFDGNGCSGSQTFTIYQPLALSATAIVTSPVLCNGGAAMVTVSATGGTSPYTGTGAFSVSSGSYSYQVSDANGCVSGASVNVTQPAKLQAIATSGTIACSGGTTNVTVSATGGVTPYNGTGTFTVPAGSYSYQVSDANGCTSTASVVVTQPTVLVAASTATVINCNGGTSTVSVSASGGTAPYTGTGAFTVSAGSYNYTVSDSRGCTSVTSISVTQPAVFSVSVSASGPTTFCNGGSVTLSASGASTYQWNNGATTASISVSSSGTYNVTATNADGCTAVSSNTVVTVSPVVTPVISISANPAGAVTPSTAVTFTASVTNGGSSPIYQWRRNGANVGTNSATYSNSNWVNGDVISCILTSNANCTAVATANSNNIIMTVNNVVSKYVVVDITQNRAYYYDSLMNFIVSNVLSTSIVNGVTNASDVAIVSSLAYVLDQTNKRIYRSSATGTVAAVSRTLNTNTGTAIGTPTGLAISGDTLWVLDKTGKAVYRYSLSAAFSGTGTLSASLRITLNSKNSAGESLFQSQGFLYVLDNSNSKTFYRYPKAGGTAVVSRAMRTNTGATMGALTGAVLDNGLVRVVDNGVDRSYTYSLSALFTGTTTLSATANNLLNTSNANSTGIAVTSSTTVLRQSEELPLVVAEEFTLQAFPNPTENLLHVRIEKAKPGLLSVRLFDLNGKLVDEKSLSVALEGNAETEFDLSLASAGLYVLQVIGEGAQKSLLIDRR
ncbi:MAG: PKD domain-containing protein [Bacteroidota bacterium]